MGAQIDRDSFEDLEYARFSERLQASLYALERLLARPGFGTGPATIGASVDLQLIDAAGHPLIADRTVLEHADDPRIRLEVDHSHLEIDTSPILLAGRPFAELATQLEESLAETRRAAATHGARVATVGILPTLTESDLEASAASDATRSRALSAGLRRVRGEPLPLRIEGLDVLALSLDDVSLEGANTSLQLHLRVAPRAFSRTYNAAQLAIAPALSVACNSPIFLGRRLWDETRIALFRKASQERRAELDYDWKPGRVSFGHGWTRAGVLEMFAESVALHAPLIPMLSEEDPVMVEHAGRVPKLAELRLHHSTVWRWNRPVYDDVGGGQVRIELRALPAGPTVADMVANAAFLLGLTLGLTPQIDRILPGITFAQARSNFYQAARHGLDAELAWPTANAPSPRSFAARDVCRALMPTARAGLVSAGVQVDEIDRWLPIVERRLDRRVTGASWQRRTFETLRTRMSAANAAGAMLERYVAASATGAPVSEWPNDDP